MVFNERYSLEILLPSLGLIKHVHENIYHIYISVRHKVLKSCRSRMATLAHDVCDVHGASTLYIITCWQSFFIYVYA